MTARVLQVLGRSAGGIARHVAQVAEALHGDEGIAIEVAGPGGMPIPMPRPIIELEIPDGPWGHGRAVSRLREILTGGRFDVVHAHGLRAGIDAARAARPDEIPVLLTVHNLVRPEIAGRLRASVYGWAEPLAVRGAARTLCVSHEIAGHLRGKVPGSAERIEVLHLGVGAPPPVARPRAEVRAELGVTSSDHLVVTAARLSPQKALHVMLDALARLRSDVVLAILGRGELGAQLRTRAERLGVDRQVRWLGFRPDAPDLIAAADVFCLSSDWEGVPLAAQEAILLGTPVVGTAVGGMPELVTDGVSGRLVPPRDPGALARALADTFASEPDRRAYAAAARTHLAAEFSTDAMLDRLRTLYLEDR